MNKKILVLDDDSDIREILSYILAEAGYEVHALSTGHTLFETIAAFNPDLVLMDVMLAEMDGRELCRQLKKNNLTSLIPVILISGTHNLHLTLHQTGAPDDFIAKPFDIDNLLLVISNNLPDGKAAF